MTDFLLNNMAIFFVPAGVSLIQSLGLIAENIVVLILCITVSTIIIIFITGKTVDFMIMKSYMKVENNDLENE